MKIIITQILIFFSCIVYAQAAKPKVLATCSIWADMAAVIGGEMIDLDYIVPVGSDPHLYEPTPSDLLKVSKADIILINGLTFEGWLSKLIKNASGQAKVYCSLKELIPSPIQSTRMLRIHMLGWT